jgi:hypothetical protein
VSQASNRRVNELALEPARPVESTNGFSPLLRRDTRPNPVSDSAAGYNDEEADATGEHTHGPRCGHLPFIGSDGTLAYLLESGDVVDETGAFKSLDVDQKNPAACAPLTEHACPIENGHVHKPGCGHPLIRHGDHFDFLVANRLHYHHDNHCDDHGYLSILGDDEFAVISDFLPM